jgi:hypothetical protein
MLLKGELERSKFLEIGAASLPEGWFARLR